MSVSTVKLNTQLTAHTPTFVDGVNVSISPSNVVTKTGGSGWAGFARAVQAFQGDVSYDFQLSSTSVEVMIGFGLFYETLSNSQYTIISGGLYFKNGQYGHAENGALTNPDVSHTYVVGDVFTVAVVGSNFLYKKNGTTIWTIAKDTTQKFLRPMVAFVTNSVSVTTTNLIGIQSCALYSALSDTYEDAILTGFTNCIPKYDSGGSQVLKLPGVNAWDAVCKSKQSFYADCFIEAMQPIAEDVMFGFGVGSNTSYTDMPYALCMAGATYQVYELNSLKYNSGVAPTNTDVFRIECRWNGSKFVVTYLKNGTVFYTSLNDPGTGSFPAHGPSNPWNAQFALNEPGAYIYPIRLGIPHVFEAKSGTTLLYGKLVDPGRDLYESGLQVNVNGLSYSVAIAGTKTTIVTNTITTAGTTTYAIPNSVHIPQMEYVVVIGAGGGGAGGGGGASITDCGGVSTQWDASGGGGGGGGHGNHNTQYGIDTDGTYFWGIKTGVITFVVGAGGALGAGGSPFNGANPVLSSPPSYGAGNDGSNGNSSSMKIFSSAGIVATAGTKGIKGTGGQPMWHTSGGVYTVAVVGNGGTFGTGDVNGTAGGNGALGGGASNGGSAGSGGTGDPSGLEASLLGGATTAGNGGNGGQGGASGATQGTAVAGANGTAGNPGAIMYKFVYLEPNI